MGEQVECEVKTSRAAWTKIKEGKTVATKAAANEKSVEGVEVETRWAKVE